jgi:epoxyqueuosine reductase
MPPARLNVELLRQWARELGLAEVGVAPIDESTLDGEGQAQQVVERWVQQQHHASLSYMQAPRLSPLQLLPSAKSVIVALAATERVSPQTDKRERTGEVAAYAQGLDYHHVLKVKLHQLSQRLCNSLGTRLETRVCVDTAPILERYWATAAGVAFVGKSTMAIAPGIGSRVVIGLVLIDQTVESSQPVLDGCGECTRCLDQCPTQAFPEPYVLDARRCISYLTIENPGTVDPDLRASLGERVFGCDVCQTVCPYNASRKLPEALSELRATPLRQAANLPAWLNLTSSDYRRLTQQSALRRTPRAQLQRNAAVALGNTQDASMVPELGKALVANVSPLVREHCAWALGQLSHLDPKNVRQFLDAAQQSETDVGVRTEIERVLAAATASTPDTSG